MGHVKGDVEPDGCPCGRIAIAIFLGLMILLTVLLTCLLQLSPFSSSQSPNSNPGWNPNSPSVLDPCPSKRQNLISFPDDENVVLTNGDFIVDRNVSVNSITISDLASLTVIDDGTPIRLRTKYILIENQGALLIGGERCPHRSPLEIVLYGRSDDPFNHDVFGRKFIGAAPTSSIDIHGPWKLAWTFLNSNIDSGANDVILSLADEADSWKPGDRIVVASSDYDMNHAEEFELEQCDGCQRNQIKIKGPAKYFHQGLTPSNWVDMRAEVGLLTRNIKIYAETETSCYGNNYCQFFNFDSFGGSIQIKRGTQVARFEGIELFRMGQQAWTARYPIHFHRAFESYGNYVRQMSIHNCFSRCVTVHSTYGLLVEDVVGYDTYGHCFFFPDGNELNNTLNHNLGLVTRAGTFYPSERNETTCLALTANRSVEYTPDPDKECKAVSTFFISHPSNYFTNNSAAGSEGMGFYYHFHRIPTGPSQGMLPPFHGERSPLGIFSGNRAHSNRRVGFHLDRGVKTDPPSAVDPRDQFALIDLQKYQPHVDRNLALQRAPAHIERFTGYMNPLGMFVRGGDVWIWKAMLSDNDVGVMMASSPSLPYDEGSHQELVDSSVFGTSTKNISGWSDRSGPCVGVEIRDGPVSIRGNLFCNFTANSARASYAIGFYPNNTGQNSPANVIKDNDFVNVDTKLFFGQVGGQLGPYFGSYDRDGDLTQIVYDPSGDVVGDGNPVYVVRADNPLFNDSSCQMNGTNKICSERDYGQLFINATSKTVSLAIQDITAGASQPLTLNGVDKTDNKQHPTTTQFQPVLIANHTYKVQWLNDTPPSSVNFSMHNFEQNSFIELQICYPPSTVLLGASLLRLYQANDTFVKTSDVTMDSADWNGTADQQSAEARYFWNPTAGILHVKLQATWPSRGYSYCASDGWCHFFSIVANVTQSGQYTCSA